MELIIKNMVSLHLIDENFLFTDELTDKYSWKKKFEVKHYPSAEKFIAGNKNYKLAEKGIHIVILAVLLDKPDKELVSNIVNRLTSFFPSVEIIRICHEKDVAGAGSFMRKGNVIKIVNNENTLLRIDNAVKWVIAKTNMDNKRRIYKLTLCFLVASIIISAAFALFFL